ncbi:polysaccharide lyase family 8 protein [Botryobasidium botryosum FD-172 SS1]|uniref:Polysaccharide lyase family 8 protein n=1 Tax=Botryobasidium botryosum (strain FD-172 SS1) TaxID=930990 RepID=A0A067MIH1_BOTB1|nr:polysaccharide lyase family 8 protein [Botryobasidium botryosum FD-172 SS1]
MVASSRRLAIALAVGACTDLVRALPLHLRLHKPHTRLRRASSLPVQLSSDLDAVYEGRVSSILNGVGSVDSIDTWLSTQNANGTWPDFDYTSGCPARRANWPAGDHWSRVVALAAAYHGGLTNSSNSYVNSTTVRSSIDSAMDWWFGNDYEGVGCQEDGGTSKCPCGTPGMWNTNWFSNLILVPRSVGQVCLLLLKSTPPLSSTQLGNCTHFTSRSFGTFHTNTHGHLTGANALDVSSIGISSGLIQGNESVLTEAYGYIHNEVVVRNTPRADGIRGDGSFSQHSGILYDGNYGKDYTNDILDLELPAVGTQWEAGAAPRTAFSTLVDGFQWMMYRNILTDVLHWDFSVIGRMITFPVADGQASSSILINLTDVSQLGAQWNNSDIVQIVNRLNRKSGNANTGPNIGNRMFYDNDYMVHRGIGYVSTLKMFSSRTTSTECTNSQNPYGFHLSDGTTYTYLVGDEYEDISAAWDWELIPGTTVDYGATPLECDTTGQKGDQAFVGGASDGRVGVSAMRYVNPLTGSLSWQKSWFFFEGGVHKVMVAGVKSETDSPVYSVLDQRRQSGPVHIDGRPVAPGDVNVTRDGARSLWHANTGYTFDDGLTVSVSTGKRTGAWTDIGASLQPPVTVDLFAAYIQHDATNLDTPISYTVYPAIPRDTFASISASASVSAQETNSTKSPRSIADTSRIVTIQNDALISAAFDTKHTTVMAVFWAEDGGSVTIPIRPAYTVQSNRAVTLIVSLERRSFTVADPSQSLNDVTLTFQVDGLVANSVTVVFDDETLGKSVTQPLP